MTSGYTFQKYLYIKGNRTFFSCPSCSGGSCDKTDLLPRVMSLESVAVGEIYRFENDKKKSAEVKLKPNHIIFNSDILVKENSVCFSAS